MAGARSMAVRAIDAAFLPNISSRSSRRTGVAVSRKPSRLTTSFLQSNNSFSHGRRRPSSSSSAPRSRKRRSLVVVDELAGQYEEGFEDVETEIINYFTYKATRTVLHQLYEMNPPKYSWFYNFLVENKPTDGILFLRHLGKEKQDLAERVMITRLHLYGKWIKNLDHAKMYEKISEENLALMRERLMETVIWPSDDTNTEKIG